MNKSDVIEKAADCLCNRFHDLSCRSCGNKSTKTCLYCNTGMLWALSKKEGRDMAEKVLKILEEAEKR
jgi:hypothetical protein